MAFNDWRERDRLAMRIYRFNTWVEHEHPDIKLRFSIIKKEDCPAEYVLKINGVVYYKFYLGFITESTMDAMFYLKDQAVYDAIMENMGQ